MIKLEYFDGKNWRFVRNFLTEKAAWEAVGKNNKNYRTIDSKGKILTDKSGGKK